MRGLDRKDGFSNYLATEGITYSDLKAPNKKILSAS